MTEYDYSPEAFERHLATQQRIAKWVDQTQESSPANPFLPLPGEHTTSTTQIPHPHTQPQPQPAFYATPQGVISPSYTSSRMHGHSQRPSPSRRGTPTMPQGHGPVMTRSFSTPPTPVRNFYPVPTTPYASYPTGSPFNPLPYHSPYQPSPISHSPHLHPSHSQSSFHSVPSSYTHVNPVIPQQPGGNNSYSYFQPSPPQPVQVLVNGGGGGCVVVPAPGQHVRVIVCHFLFYFSNYSMLFCLVDSF